MRSRQLALCAAVAACAVTTAPAYGGDERATGAATGTATVLAHPAPATPRGTVALRGTGCAAGRATVRSAAFHDAAPLTRAAAGMTAGTGRIRSGSVSLSHPRTAACPSGTGRTSLAARTVQAGAAAGAAAGHAARTVQADAAAVHLSHPSRAMPADAAAVHPARSLPQPAKATKAARAAKAASSDELSSTSAVGLVLAGGAILVIAGQLLRLRLRLRRERRGDADER
ncbi:hypothetical protein GTW98_27615 [Streptomyces sp. SID8375]|uniref:hypothetical protein n=1 Tax=unclassified Streptomyces TaxID=2593676 RepID=UPI000367BF46|nr:MULTISPECIES: hypothetical protein [unclassified Streptomyces]MYX10527.1 hypothetical protein [Streptomyces sp. SID8375]